MTIEELQDERRRVNGMSDDEMTAEMRQYWDGSVNEQVAADADVAAIKQRVLARIGYRRRRWSLVIRTAAACAAVVLLAATAWLYADSRMPGPPVAVATGAGERATATLPDGTTVRLNANSRVEYRPKGFNGRQRDVTFTGEAYFTVARNADCPFIVHTVASTVEVLGTQFNLRCYAADSHTTLALDHGSVRLAAAKDGSEVIMRPGDMASLDNSTGSIDVRHHADSYQTKAWLRNEMVFDKAPLDSVLEAIGQCYGRHIRIEGNYRAADTFSGTLATDNLADALGVLSSLYHLKVENNGNDIVMKGKIK